MGRNKNKVKEIKLIDRVFSFLVLFASIFMSFILIAVLYYSFKYWINNYPYGFDITGRMFYVAVGIAIVTSISQWIEGRIKAIIKEWNILFQKNERRVIKND
jgi:divalent metal cation (Fe/Co/Zn/Cd) transporter